MEVDVKGAAIGVASAVFASVGFLLSVVAVVLNPLIPASVVSDSHGHMNHPPEKSHRPRPESDLSAASSLTNSIMSESSPAPSSSDHGRSQSQSPPPLHKEFERSGSPTPTPLKRASTQKLTTLPTGADYFSLGPAGSPSVRDVRTETQGTAGIVATTPTPPAVPPATSSPSPPAVSQPITSESPTPRCPSLHPTPTPPASQPIASTSNYTSTAIPTVKSLSYDSNEVPYSSTSHPHSFRIPHFKRSWANQRNKPARATTFPEPPSLLHPSVNSDANLDSKPAISRPPSTASFKHFCPVKKIEEKTLRKSLSSPESGLSKWKSHRRKHTSTDTLQPPSQPQTQPKARPPKPPLSSSPPRHRAQPQPRPRTQPYEAPYFFPSPASPDALGYVRRSMNGRPSSSSASYSNTTSFGQFTNQPPPGQVVASAPPTKLKFTE